ncbi:MAG: YggS family pyridoxal phosphate-dependent enzyme [Thermodesulfobacteriota bacterium]
MTLDPDIFIKDNLKRTLERIDQSVLKSGRKREEVRLVAVTKRVEANRIKEAIKCGVEILGENYIQEAKDKISQIQAGVEWHFIGHLQSRKARDAVELFDVIHSVDSLKLSKELNKRGKEKGKRVRILLQVNLSNEESKSGLKREAVLPLVEEVAELKSLILEGFMMMPPFFADPEDVRPFFRNLSTLRNEISDKTGLPLKELSMGMSHDFEVAIEEGSTMIRVGTAIFGSRF